MTHSFSYDWLPSCLISSCLCFISTTTTNHRSNSILNRNAKLYSPKHALDTTNLSSCYNSDAPPEDKPILFSILFQRKISPRNIKIQFQGGFAALEFTISSTDGNEEDVMRMETDAEDVNDLQEFEFEDSFECTGLKIRFDDSADFYGRITIYRLEVWGYECP